MKPAKLPAIARAMLKLSKEQASIAGDIRLVLADAEGVAWADELAVRLDRLAVDLREAAVDVEHGRREFAARAEPAMPLFDPRPAKPVVTIPEPIPSVGAIPPGPDGWKGIGIGELALSHGLMRRFRYFATAGDLAAGMLDRPASFDPKDWAPLARAIRSAGGPELAYPDPKVPPQGDPTTLKPKRKRKYSAGLKIAE